MSKDFESTDNLVDEKPANMGPINQEARKGHALLPLGNDVFVEVSLFKGKTYAGIRKWFQADDGVWYRTKNGLNMRCDEVITVLNQYDRAIEFIRDEMVHPFEDS